MVSPTKQPIFKKAFSNCLLNDQVETNSTVSKGLLWFSKLSRAFPSCLLPLFQGKSSCETSQMKMSSAYRFIFSCKQRHVQALGNSENGPLLVIASFHVSGGSRLWAKVGARFWFTCSAGFSSFSHFFFFSLKIGGGGGGGRAPWAPPLDPPLHVHGLLLKLPRCL